LSIKKFNPGKICYALTVQKFGQPLVDLLDLESGFAEACQGKNEGEWKVKSAPR
jgi:hypothetical protein